MGQGIIHASGKRLRVIFGKQLTYGTPVLPDKNIRITTEAIQNVFSFVTSEEPSPQRGTVDLIEQGRAPSGTFNFEPRAQSMGCIVQSAFGSDVDTLTIPNCDGGIRSQVFADYTSGSLFLDMRYIDPDGFPAAGGSFDVACRTDGDTAKQLVYTTVQYASHDNQTFTLSAPIGSPYDDYVKVEDWVFLHETTPNLWDGVYTQVHEMGDKIETVGTWGVLRDIVIAYYYDAKTNTYSEEYPTNDKLTGSFEIIAGAEFFSVQAATDVLTGDTTIEIDDPPTGEGVNHVRDLNIFLQGLVALGQTPLIWVNRESGIECGGFNPTTKLITGIPGSGDTSIENDHLLAPWPAQIAIASIPAITRLDLQTPFSSWSASLTIQRYNVQGYPMETQNVMGMSWSVNNNLDDSKVEMGSQARAALLDGDRLVEGSLDIEHESPLEYSRALRGVKFSMNVNCVGERIGSTTVRYQMGTVFHNAKFKGNTPNVGGPGMIRHDMPFTGLVMTRKAEVMRVFVNDQSDALAGG